MFSRMIPRYLSALVWNCRRKLRCDRLFLSGSRLPKVYGRVSPKPTQTVIVVYRIQKVLVNLRVYLSYVFLNFVIIRAFGQLIMTWWRPSAASIWSELPL